MEARMLRVFAAHCAKESAPFSIIFTIAIAIAIADADHGLLVEGSHLHRALSVVR
jgi:hypothetical protein